MNERSGPATDWKEVVAPDEEERYAGYARQIEAVQRRRAEKGQAARAFHAKALVGARAELRVLPDLPEHARVGVFAAPATYQAWVRFSNGAVRRQADGKQDVRGVAVKVLGVPGTKIIPGLEAATTQDFLLIQTPVFTFRNAADFMFFVGASRRPLLLPLRLLARFGLRGTGQILGRVRKYVAPPVPSLATLRTYSALPIAWGRHAAKYSLVPAATAAPSARSNAPDHLHAEMAGRLRAGPVSYHLCAQFFVDETRTPIENPTILWTDAVAPPVRVAELVLPEQDADSPAGQRDAAYVEKLSFDPWHAPVEFRPLGDVMRARKVAYYPSSSARQALAEPAGTTWDIATAEA